MDLALNMCIGVSQIPNVALIAMPVIVYMDTPNLRTLSLSKFSISIRNRLLFGENHLYFHLMADLQTFVTNKSKDDKKNSFRSQHYPFTSTIAAGYWLILCVAAKTQHYHGNQGLEGQILEKKVSISKFVSVERSWKS